MFASMVEQRVEALAAPQDQLIDAHAAVIADFALKRRIPSAGNKAFAEKGGLIGYGVEDAEIFRRAASFVDKLLKGAKPGDLPVEQASKFELVVNLRTAKALGIVMPASLLLRADTVIQ